MTTTIECEKVYLDANFLIYWFIAKEPEHRKRARYLWAKLLAKKNRLYSSVLSFDEAWWGIKHEYKQQNDVDLSCGESPLFEKLENFTKAILPKIDIIQFNDAKRGILTAANHMKEFNFKPRDAFHLAIMKNNNITIIATDDSDFVKNEKTASICVLSIL